MSAEIASGIDLGAGALAQVFADLARFQTNVTMSDTPTEIKKRDGTSYSDDCNLPIIETYELGLGAEAGVFVEFGHDTWGPTPETSIQIFYTTLYSACATSASTTQRTNSAGVTSLAEVKRKDPSPSTLKSAISVYAVTNVLCQNPSLRDCPASLQSTNQTFRTSTVYSYVSKGSDMTLPATATTGSPATVQTFGSDKNQIKASSGGPVSHIPPTSTSLLGGVEDQYEGFSDKGKKLAIGLSFGLGIVFLTTLAASLW